MSDGKEDSWEAITATKSVESNEKIKRYHIQSR